MIRLDQATHTYFLGDDVIPGVSGILKFAGKIKGYYGKDNTARDRGTAIHEATEAMDNLGLCPLDFDEELHPWLRAWEQFKNDTGCKILAVESLLYHEDYKYAGTMDRLVHLEHGNTVIDIKSGSPADWHKYQVAAYGLAYTRMTGTPLEHGLCVYLKPNGRYTIKQWSDITFQAAQIEFASWASEYHERNKTNE